MAADAGIPERGGLPGISTGERLIRFNGRALDAAGQPVVGVAGVTFAIYEEQNGGAPLWQETQNLATGADGRFSALLGATSATGIPPELFASGDSRWLGVLTQAPGASEQPRILLVSVPYALRSADSEMLGGKPASAYLTANALATDPGGCLEAGAAPPVSAAKKVAPALSASAARAGYLPVFTDALGDLGNSLIAQSGSFVGIGTAAPAAALDVVGANPTLRVDNYSNTVGDSPNFNFLSARGTSAAPGATKSGDNLGQFAAAGYNGSAFPGSKAKVSFVATQNSTSGRQRHRNDLCDHAQRLYGSQRAPAHRQHRQHRNRHGHSLAHPELWRKPGAHPGVEANSTAGSAGNNLTISAGAAASGAPGRRQPDPGGRQRHRHGRGRKRTTAGGGQWRQRHRPRHRQRPAADRRKAEGNDRGGPTANLFSMHIATGDAAGGRVKFTIVASDGVNYAAETGEIIYLATPKQVECAVVQSEISPTPPTYTNTVMAVGPGAGNSVGQPGWLSAICTPAYFGSNPGFQISDTQPNWFTPTTHKVYYTIENQSQAVITLQP